MVTNQRNNQLNGLHATHAALHMLKDVMTIPVIHTLLDINSTKRMNIALREQRLNVLYHLAINSTDVPGLAEISNKSSVVSTARCYQGMQLYLHMHRYLTTRIAYLNETAYMGRINYTNVLDMPVPAPMVNQALDNTYTSWLWARKLSEGK